jgi:hypothetical protein
MDHIIFTIQSTIGNIPYKINNVFQISDNLINVDVTTFQCGFPCRKNLQFYIKPDSIIDLRTQKISVDQSNNIVKSASLTDTDSTALIILKNLSRYLLIQHPNMSSDITFPNGSDTTTLYFDNENFINPLVDNIANFSDGTYDYSFNTFSYNTTTRKCAKHDWLTQQCTKWETNTITTKRNGVIITYTDDQGTIRRLNYTFDK